MASRAERLWWRDGVIYQIYPRSFMDADGDGVGDLEGIRSRLEHLSWLGVDALWLSPCFPSPMADFGYDVADYCGIDPLFGSLADFDRLLTDAHRLGLRVILDFVPNHSSDRHPWFRESRSSRDAPRRDWYVWRDPAPDGSPPNNWLAHFGGPAWTLDEATGQYYLHSFLKQQPDLDWRNPEVEAAMHEVLRFWLERGVDGFRIDVIHRIAKDPALRDNPLLPGREGHGFGGQRHLHDENHPDVHAMLRRLRGLLDAYPERMAVGEVYILDPAEVAKYYGRGDELHLAFNFSFLHAPFSARALGREIERFLDLVPEGCWPDWVLSSHDAPRHASRFDHPELGEARTRLAATLLLSLRGTPFLYQGEEIGMRNVAIPRDRLRDPIAFSLHPNASRDPSRTPLPWEPGPGAGFSRAEPWLPLGPDTETRNVARQREDPDSLLWLYRRLLALRRSEPALHRGSQRTLEAGEDTLAFLREAGGSRALAVLHCGEKPVRLSLPGGAVRGGLRSSSGRPLPASTDAIELDPCEGAILLLDQSSGSA